MSTATLKPSTRDPRVFGKVAVVYGGASAEREVSLQSGAAVLAGLQAGGIDAHGVDPHAGNPEAGRPGATYAAPRLVQTLCDGGFQRVFIILHGRGGEDGTLQGALEVAGMPYTGSGVLGSALAMDKHRAKLVWRALEVATLDYRLVRNEAELYAAGRALGLPLVVKPVHEGSSIGVSRAGNDEELLSAWFEASRYDGDVIAEPWLEGDEYTAGIVDGVCLPLIRLETPHVFYDYDAKYADDAGTRYHLPCGLTPEREREFQALSLRAFEAVGASGWGRVDFRCDTAGKPYMLDVNTAPGMTGHSLVPMAAAASGLDFGALVWRILETTL
ncbi:MAG: D-alanine--D-alanine ligase [Gammaproteobacteria bacterium]